MFQRLLDEALEAWTRDGGWAAFTADALAALQDVVERLPKGRDAVVVTIRRRCISLSSIARIPSGIKPD